VLALGDLQYEHGEYRNFLGAYDHSWGRFKNLTRPTVGNHEYLDPAGPAAGYFRYFGRQAGNPAKGYYSVDIGPWHAIALDSNCGAAGAPSCAHGSAQWAWLKHDLTSHHQRCTLAFFHHSYRSSTGAHTGKAELKHLHAPWTVIAGTGGRSLVPITSVHPNSVARAAVFGVLVRRPVRLLPVVGDRSRAPRDDPAWLPAPWRPEVKDPGAGPIG